MLSETAMKLVAPLTFLLMVGLGASLTPDDFRRALSRRRGVLIGLASQYGWMPLLGFAAAHVFDLPNDLAIGLLLMTCAAGGNASNLLTWFARGDVALSVSMTCISGVLGVVAMPMLLAVYARGFTDAQLVLPYAKIAVTLLATLATIAVGMAVRRYRPRWAPTVERFGKGCGGAMLTIVPLAAWDSMMAQLEAMTGAMLGAVLGVASAGTALGFGAAWLGGLARAERRAVAFETSVQNAPVVMGVVMVSFPEELHVPLLQMPILYATFAVTVGIAVTLLIRTIDHLRGDVLAEAPMPAEPR